MSLPQALQSHAELDIGRVLAEVTRSKVEDILARRRLTELDFLALLSDTAGGMLEDMARRAHELTRRHFGQVVQLFTPLYISNYCENGCLYCSFARQNRIDRRHLSIEEIRAEAERISASGMRHILLLTGESRTKAPPKYLVEAVKACGEYFSSIGIEVYPLSRDEYRALVDAGVDLLTLYQEVYDRETYARLHPVGPKHDYDYRLDAPERACRAGIHSVSIGPLLGLADSRREALATALHLRHLQKTYPGTEIGLSLPRMRPLVASFDVEHEVSDRQFVQLLTAFRIAFPTVGITVSTRESRRFRDAVLPMGVTRMSAGVSTAVGGRASEGSTTQFEIADTRTVDDMRHDLLRMGYQPVMHDWHHGMLSSTGD